MWKILQHLISTEYYVCKTTSTHNLRHLSHFSFHVKHHLDDVISSFPPTGLKQTFAMLHRLVEFKAYQTSQGYWPMSSRSQGFLHTVPEEEKKKKNKETGQAERLTASLRIFFCFYCPLLSITLKLRKVGCNLTARQELVQMGKGMHAQLRHRKSWRPQNSALQHLNLNTI